jgi:formylglycine-generating enzyme required for sulfatase activity
MPTRKYLTPEVLQDSPLQNERMADFHFDDFSATLARLIASPQTDTPFVIGINGAWGSGKTSLLMRVKNMLDEPVKAGRHRFANTKEEEKNYRKCKTVWFDAWKYNDEKELLVALVRVILQTMQRDGLINKFTAWLEDPTQPTYDLSMFINAFEVNFGGLGAGLKFKIDPEKHKTPSKFEQYMAFFDYFDEAFGRLLNLWVHDKVKVSEDEMKKGALVVFIDDLDRCLPDKTVQVLEALKLFFDKRGCVFLLGADIKIVQGAVETHYKNVGITGESARDYLEKIIQLRFDLPPILGDAMEKHLRSQGVNEAMLKRWQTLVAAAEVNPRRVKSVINDLNLQWAMAKNSGQAEGVDRDDFICWQALMHAAPAVFARQVSDFEDKAIRFGFIQDALKWQNGKQKDKDTVKGFFSAYEDKDSKRLRGVLRQISFSAEFSLDALEAMIYMTAPPAKPEPVGRVDNSTYETPIGEEPKKTLELEVAGEEIFAEVVMRGEPRERGKGVVLRDGNRLIIGGTEFMRVPVGKFIMGSKDDNSLASENEKPQHTIDINYDYWMAKFVITNEQYAQYLGKDKHPVSDWQKKKDHPVVSVSWDDAMQYCQWFNQTFKSELGDLLLRLPTEAEWEKAARGAYGNEWPWGNEFDPQKCNSAEGKKGGTTSPVGAYSSLGGDSPYGCADMAGNVLEWTHTLYEKYPYVAGDGREDEKSREDRVLRGGSFYYYSRVARCAYRYRYDPFDLSRSSGFRVAVSPIPSL